MPRNDDLAFTVRNARLLFRNFSGKESMYNKEGDRNFCFAMSPEDAVQFEADGWNVKTLNPREDYEETEPTPYLQVKVNFKNRPPHIVMITSNARTNLDKDSVGVLDFADIKKVDFKAVPYNYDFNGKTGIKPYLKTMFVTIEEDELEAEYGSIAGMEED